MVLVPAFAADSSGEDQSEDTGQQIIVYCDCGTALAANEEEMIEAYEAMAAAEIEDGFGVGTSNVTIFEGLASKLDYGTHYVYFREGQYQYKFVYSPDLQLSGTSFYAPSVTVITYTTSSSYNSQATWSVSTESNFSLAAGNYLVWSDLGSYPQLYARGGVDYAKTACIILASFGVMWILHRIRSALFRR